MRVDDVAWSVDTARCAIGSAAIRNPKTVVEVDTGAAGRRGEPVALTCSGPYVCE